MRSLRLNPVRLSLRLLAAAPCALLGVAGAAAQTQVINSPGWTMPASPPGAAKTYDLNTPVLGTGQGSVYDLNISSKQNGPPGTIAVTSMAPAPVFDLDRMLANTHGYVSAGVSTHNGHNFEGGVTVPIVPGRADLDLGYSTGQLGGFPPVAPGGKLTTVNYDAYYAGLALHPTDDFSAYIGVTGLRMRAPSPYGYPYASPYAVP